MTALLDYSIDELLEALETHKRFMTDAQVYTLAQMVRTMAPEEADPEALVPADQVMNGLMNEIQQQLQYVTKLRQSITTRTSSSQEVKNMVQATSSLFTMLTKMNTEITNQDRLRKVELATIEAIKTLPELNQQEFFTELERLLEHVK